MYREIRSYANSIWDDNNNNNYAPEIHRTSMYTEYTYYKRYVIAYEVQDTWFSNNTPGHP